MVFNRNKDVKNATKVANNLNYQCTKLKQAIDSKKDLKANKIKNIYHKSSALKQELEGIATKFLDSNNLKEFENVADVLHKTSEILNIYEKLTNKISLQNLNIGGFPNPSHLTNFAQFNSGGLNSVSQPNNLSLFNDRESPDTLPEEETNENLEKLTNSEDWANFEDQDDLEELDKDKGLNSFEAAAKVEEAPEKTKKSERREPSSPDKAFRSDSFPNDSPNSVNDFSYQAREDYPNPHSAVSTDKYSSSRQPSHSGKKYHFTNGNKALHYNEDRKFNDNSKYTEGSKFDLNERDDQSARDGARHDAMDREKLAALEREREERAKYAKLLEKCLNLTKYRYLVGELQLYDDLTDKIAILSDFLRNVRDGRPGRVEDVARGEARPVRSEDPREARPEFEALPKFEQTKLNVFSLDDTQLLGKEVEPLWRSEKDGGLSNYLSNFFSSNADYNIDRLIIVNNEDGNSYNKHHLRLWDGSSHRQPFDGPREKAGLRKLVDLDKLRVSLDVNELNYEELLVNVRLAVSLKIRVSNVYLFVLYQDSSVLLFTNNPTINRRIESDLRGRVKVRVEEEGARSGDNAINVNLKMSIGEMVDMPTLRIRMVENDGNQSDLKIKLPIGLFSSLVPLRRGLEEFDENWANPNQKQVNRLFLSRSPVDLGTVAQLLEPFFATRLEPSFVLLSAHGSQPLLGVVRLRGSCLLLLQLRSSCSQLISSVFGLLRQVLSVLDNPVDPNLARFKLRSISSLPLPFQANISFYKN